MRAYFSIRKISLKDKFIQTLSNEVVKIQERESERERERERESDEGIFGMKQMLPFHYVLPC